MIQRRRILGAAIVLLLLSVFLSGCGAAQVAQNWPGLTLADDTLYVISGTPQKVYILDADTGEQKGTFVPQEERKGVSYWSPVAVGGGLAFVGYVEPQSEVAGLYAFDPETGQQQWKVAVQDIIIPAPVYAEGVVYFGSSDGRLYAVDVETQSVKPGWPFQANEAIWGSPLVVGNRVYLAAKDHHLYSLDAETGETIWKHQVGGAMSEQPALEDGILYVGAFDGKAYAIDADTGEVIPGFEFQAENWIWSKVLVADGVLYVTALDGKLYALDPATGAVTSPYPYDTGASENRKDALRASPVEAGDSIIIASEYGQVTAVQAAMRQWVWPSGVPQAGVLTTPVVSPDGNTVYVVLMDGQVQALDAETGASRPGWPFVPPTED